MKRRVAGRVLGFALGLGFPLAIGLSAPSSFQVHPPASRILMVQAGDPKEAEAKELLDRCKHSSLAYYNCECMVAEYRIARAAAPSQYEALKTYDRTRTKCYDRKQVEEHHAKAECARENQRIEIMRKGGVKRDLIDCACYGRRFADLVMSGKHPAGREMSDALLSCPAR